MPPPVPPSPSTGRLGTAGLTPAEVRRRALTRLSERIDLARSRHKPISLLRQEARRVLDTYFDLEVPLWPKADRDKLAEDVIAEALGLGPLDELFRDESVQEFMVLAHNQVIARKGDVWLPTSVNFREPAQYRQALAKLAEQVEPVQPGPQPAGAIDGRLPNGFRLVAVLPPAVLDQQPVAAFVRGLPPAAPDPGKGSSTILGVPEGLSRSSIPGSAPSGKLNSATPELTVSGTVRYDPVRGSGSVSSRSTTRLTNPMLWARERVTDLLSKKLAAAGVYDVSRIPPSELLKVVVALVEEFSAQEKLGFDTATSGRLALEIVTAIPR